MKRIAIIAAAGLAMAAAADPVAQWFHFDDAATESVLGITNMVWHYKMNDNAANTQVAENISTNTGTAQTNTSVTLTMGADWPTNAAHYVPVSVLLGTNEWRYNGDSITNWAGASFPSLTNEGPSSLILHRPAWGTKWGVRGGYVQ